MERFDLAHVDPTEGGFDALGKGVQEGKPTGAGHYVSRGLTRSRTDKLVVVPSSTVGVPADGGHSGGQGGARITALASRGEAAGATALKSEPEHKLSPAEQLEAQLPLPRSDNRTEAKATAAARRAEAKAKGYEGEMCGECLNFTLVRNGTCLKCDTCGSTTGCS
jgi:ribonucleoside-diphosphate reductase alpha chain